jgi:nitronate monooxygenase
MNQQTAAERCQALAHRLGTRWPILQAPMAGVQGSALAMAVSRAGGLGALPCAMLGADALRQELAAVQAAGCGPVNVNFFAHTTPPSDAVAEARWRAALAPYAVELGIDLASAPAGAGRQPFSAAAAGVLAEFKPAVVSFHFGLPEPALLARLRSWGALVLSTATTVAEARWLAERGVDAVIAQGLEAGGHRGHFLSHDLSQQAGTLALLPQVVAAVDCPVIAAGGIADAAGVAAAIALGATGVQVGTSYLRADEASTSALHRAALASPAGAHTALTNLFSGRPARGIVNRVMHELGPISALAPAFPLATAAMAPLRAAAERRGSTDFTPLWAGQNVSGCRAAPAADITRALATGLPT